MVPKSRLNSLMFLMESINVELFMLIFNPFQYRVNKIQSDKKPKEEIKIKSKTVRKGKINLSNSQKESIIIGEKVQVMKEIG